MRALAGRIVRPGGALCALAVDRHVVDARAEVISKPAPQRIAIATVLSMQPKILVLDEGRIVADGPARDLLADAALMERHGLESIDRM